MFGEPARDILLDLFAAHEAGLSVTVSSVCIAAHVSTSTALRWISALEERGQLIHQTDPRDRRRINVSLTNEAAAKMRGLL